MQKQSRLVLLSLMGLLSCDHPDERSAEWSTIHTAIIVPSCATSSCHSSLAKVAGIVLDDSLRAYETLVGNRFVIPGALDSPLLYLLNGTQRPLMPPDAPLPAADVRLIEEWIELGAKR